MRPDGVVGHPRVLSDAVRVPPGLAGTVPLALRALQSTAPPGTAQRATVPLGPLGSPGTAPPGQLGSRTTGPGSSDGAQQAPPAGRRRCQLARKAPTHSP